MTPFKFFPKVILSSFLLIFGGRTLCWAALAGQIFFDDEEKTMMIAGAATNLKVEVSNPDSPDPIHHFHPMHEKKMHLILISEDLESFAHLHPEQLSEHLGIFGVNLNQATQDPYNLDAAKAVQKPGTYYLFAESMPMGYSMTTLPMDFTATGGMVSLRKPLILDPVFSDNIVYKKMNNYEVKLQVKTYPHCDTFSVLIEVELKYWDSLRDSYLDILDLQPWLNSFAHIIMVSEQGRTAQEKNFTHLHAVWPLTDDPETERGPYLRMASDNHSPLTEGIFKIWLQFKHHDQVQTIPFVIEIKAPPPPPNSSINFMCL